MIDCRIDVHQHFIPDYYRTALLAAGVSQPDGMAAIPDWNEATALAALDRLGIDTAFLSISSPGVHFGDDVAARALARRTNEDAARLTKAYPGRFGFFAVTSLPDVTGALDEIAYALDVLGADGVVFETNFGGVYLGDDLLAPIYAELNQREAVIFLHPTSPHCRCAHGSHVDDQPPGAALGYPAPMLDFLFETTRTITQMLLSGTLQRHPNIRVIVPHAGACLPILAGRIELLMHAGAGDVAHAPSDIRAALRKLHYDMAGAPVPELLGALLQIADPERLHYGSDWPFTPVAGCERLLKALKTTGLFDEAGREAMMAGNARRLFAHRLDGSRR